MTSNPELVVFYPQIGPTGNVLTFLLSGGIAGQQYKLTITINTTNSAVRNDVLTISIPSSDECGCEVINPVPAIYNQAPLWGGGYINTAVRLFWGSVPPSNPNAMDQWLDSSDTLWEWMRQTAQTAFWGIISSPNYVMDAPLDGALYSRSLASWCRRLFRR